MPSCPECGSTYVRRVARTPSMRLLWGSELLLCSDCGERSLVFPKLRKFVARHPKLHEFVKRLPDSSAVARIIPERQRSS